MEKHWKSTELSKGVRSSLTQQLTVIIFVKGDAHSGPQVSIGSQRHGWLLKEAETPAAPPDEVVGQKLKISNISESETADTTGAEAGKHEK